MRTSDIPFSFTVTDDSFGGQYSSDNGRHEDSRTWYPPQQYRELWPHATTVKKDDVADTLTGLNGQSSPSMMWWAKFHLSVPLGGTNVHLFYKIDANYRVSASGSNLQYVPQYKRDLALQHVNRQSTDYRDFAQSFVDAARAKFKSEKLANVVAPMAVGPQTATSFYSDDGL